MPEVEFANEDGGLTTRAILRAVGWREGDLEEDFQHRDDAGPAVVAGQGQEGDERFGRFSHDLFKGEYRMVGRTVVAITDKPPIVPWPIIEARLRRLVG